MVALALSYATGIIEISLTRAKIIMRTVFTLQPVANIIVESVKTKIRDAATR